MTHLLRATALAALAFLLTLWRIIAIGAVVFFTTVLLAGSASAATVDPTTVNNNIQVLALVNLVISFVAPLVIQVITHSTASTQFKTILTLAVTAVVGAFTPFLSGDQTWPPTNYSVVFISAASVFLTSVLSHYGLWKPLGVTGANGSISSLIPGGLGNSLGGNLTSVPNDTVPPTDTVVTGDVPPVLPDPVPAAPAAPVAPVAAPAPVQTFVAASVTPPADAVVTPPTAPAADAPPAV